MEPPKKTTKTRLKNLNIVQHLQNRKAKNYGNCGNNGKCGILLL